jgi:hypothetical protein
MYLVSHASSKLLTTPQSHKKLLYVYTVDPNGKKKKKRNSNDRPNERRDRESV